MPRTQLTLATCNLYNRNEPNLGMYRDRNGWSQEEYDKKIVWFSNIFTLISSDIWAFQELWHADSLNNLFDDSYTLLVPPNHKGKIICAGDDPQTSKISVTINTFSRPILHFKIKPRSNDKLIHVYLCHFKSKMPTQIYRESWYTKNIYSKHVEAIGSAISTIRRTAEAAAFKWILTEEMKNTQTPVLVLGDLNDNKHSNTLNILTGQPRYLLSGHTMGGSDVDLYSVGTLQEYRSQRDVYYTHVHNRTLCLTPTNPPKTEF